MEYLYVLSNPSMPGLVKIGKTTTTPNQRMAELHSTGVPTAFKLECSISVPNCTIAERAVHLALRNERVAANREFFRIPVKMAIERILKEVDEYEVIDFGSTHNIRNLTEAEERKKAIRAAQEAEDAERLSHENELAKAFVNSNIIRLMNEIHVLKQQLNNMGQRPASDTSGVILFLAMCYFPVPFGWIIWGGSLNIFSDDKSTIGWACVALIIAGYFANEKWSLDKKNLMRLLSHSKKLTIRYSSPKEKLSNGAKSSMACADCQ